MSWTVILENESKLPIFSLSEEFTIMKKSEYKFKLLQYLDAYGDTIFNYLQMDDLISDLILLKNDEENLLINELITLSNKCRTERHTYLVFYGD